MNIHQGINVGTSSKGFLYFVAAGFGLVLSATLVYLAWQSALQDEADKFQYASLTLKETVARGVTGGDDITNNVATLFESMDRVSEDAFRSVFQLVGRSILERYPFIDAISYHPVLGRSADPLLGSDKNPDLSDSWSVFLEKFQVKRESLAALPPYVDLFQEPRFRDALRIAIETGGVAPSPPVQSGSSYLLLKAVSSNAAATREGNQTPTGIVAVLVNPGELLARSSQHDQMSISLFSVSEGITGRQRLLEMSAVNSGHEKWGLITSFHEDFLTQFPHYSMKLGVDKNIYWGEVEKGLIVTAMVLGAGMSLLLVALARAKELQARELRERNIEIERQVQEQTKELAKARDEALEASRVKSEFLASMSHEIRTPLNAIIGMAELLNETPMTPDQKKYVDIYKKSGEALQSLVNDILDLSKIEANQLHLEKIDFNLRSLIEEAVDIYALKCDEKGIELICQITPDVPAFVNGDPSRLRQIVLNLIGNAVKFTEKGEIVVRVMPDADHQDPVSLHFSVSDTGIGIPADKLAAIFGSFTQVDSSTTRKYGGTGLGLTISTRLVELMNGRISVQSELGRGSTFSFVVRLEPAREPVQRIFTPPVDIRGMDILIVDDNSTNRLILRETLTAHGAIVHEASDGPAALVAFERALKERKEFRLILTDGQMPGMDGFAVAEAIKAAGGDVKTVLMLTSSQLSGDLTRARKLGVGAYLVKPVKWSELHKAIQQAFAPAPLESEERVTSGAVEHRASPENRILLVEDTADNRLLVKAYLKDTAYVIDEAENGEVALEEFKNHPYRLVLMDVQMPVMDGHEATRRMRAWEKEHGKAPTPIIALTAHAIKEDVEKSLAAGCTAHLTKPIKKTTLLQAIGEYSVCS